MAIFVFHGPHHVHHLHEKPYLFLADSFKSLFHTWMGHGNHLGAVHLLRALMRGSLRAPFVAELWLLASGCNKMAIIVAPRSP